MMFLKYVKLNLSSIYKMILYYSLGGLDEKVQYTVYDIYTFQCFH